MKKYKFPLLKTQEDLGLWLNLLRDGTVFIPLKDHIHFGENQINLFLLILIKKSRMHLNYSIIMKIKI